MPLVFLVVMLTEVTMQSQPSPTPTIAVWVRDEGQVPFEVLSRAEAIVERIYRAVGVNIAWQRPSAPLDTPATQPTRFIIDVLSPKRAARLPFAPTCHALGAAATGDASEQGHIGYVRYGCIEDLTEPGGLGRARVLAVVMAHELGHLLLPYPAHSATGLMKADWNLADLSRAPHGSLSFTTEQAQLIRSRLVSSLSHSFANDGLAPSDHRKH